MKVSLERQRGEEMGDRETSGFHTVAASHMPPRRRHDRRVRRTWWWGYVGSPAVARLSVAVSVHISRSRW
ncbi:hypothetical protein HanRHA438_Chr12g0571421 [Helianthus annuus]|uniref:Uncharacterized protein n=1 Tax=Helianthus annuus TaxID=4232 RepID=A0A251T4S0_HELAN|nr:hypothetical protein HanXRQr2_Chr12g0560191 [Helianthus annuus]KAJ0490748.1 hypothetical protein HanHA300_Chr12g0459131 [Helianthus annuus]KAJ0495062.1 hypothetical protein HanIR_Chr12g0604661 [Helianthus annuus]KAJ0506670.1 hypothetical protein HanHA89_Chr12g0484741 [Helianthus annuus]KAJ0676344.1 hypothetical protein HanLR1_Chr12g0461711 [Helianthus annuus]